MTLLLCLLAQEIPEFKENDLTVRVDKEGKISARNRAVTLDQLEAVFIIHLDRFHDASGDATYSVFVHADPEAPFSVIQDVFNKVFRVGTCFLTIDDKKFVELRDSGRSDEILRLRLELCFISDIVTKQKYNHREHHSGAKNEGELYSFLDNFADCGMLLGKGKSEPERKSLEYIVEAIDSRKEIESCVKKRPCWIQVDADDDVPVRVPYTVMAYLQEKKVAPVEIYTIPAFHRETEKEKRKEK